jgi:NitT/TauT family transport system permease protein
MKASIWKNKTLRELLYTALSVITLIILWKIISMILAKEILVPSPESTLSETLKIMGAPQFIPSVLNTIKRALISFVIALGSGLGLGMLAGFFKPLYYLFRPVVLMHKAVPTMAMILLALIWLESERAPILVGFVVIFPVIYESVVQGIRNVDRKLVEMTNIYKIGTLDRLKDLYLPSIRSYLYGAMSAAMGLNLKIIIAAEVLSQPVLSMGTSLQIEKSNLNTAGVFAWALITIFIAGILEQALKLLKKD